jgi:hypothetical protein
MPRARTADASPNAPRRSRVQAGPNPVACREGRGVRYFDCPHYDACLDKAAKGLWAGFTCAHCLFYLSRPTV